MPLLEVHDLTKRFPLSRSTGPFTRVTDQVRAVDKSRLTGRAGQLTGADLRAVEAGMRAVLEL